MQTVNIWFGNLVKKVAMGDATPMLCSKCNIVTITGTIVSLFVASGKSVLVMVMTLWLINILSS